MIERILNTDEASFSSSLSEEGIKRRIESLFEHKTLRLVGKLTRENEFTAYDKFVVIGWSMPYLRRKSAYLKGKITKGEKGSLIRLKVHPNSVLPVFAILAMLSGVIITITTLLKAQYDEFYSIFGLALIALGIVYYAGSTFFRNRLRNKIVKYLDLSEV